jgi:hypothetical protein
MVIHATMKERTSVVIDARLRARAQEAARRLGVSLSRLVSEALEKQLASAPARGRRRDDPVFRRRTAVAGPSDGSSNLDEYLYGRT